VQTNDAGVYNLTTVTAGTYKIEIIKEGFRSFVTPDVVLNQNNVVRVDAQLQVGAQSERVEVTSSADVLQTDRADVHAEVGTQALENLPQPTRAYEGLMQLVPGATPPSGQLAGGTNNPSKSMEFAFNGTSISGAAVRIEGVSAMNPWQQYQTTFVPSIEAIQNVNVATNATDAEQGLAGGASVNVMLKSGSNQTHGAAYGYNVDSFFHANNFFSNASGISKPAHLVDNDAGGFIGGHIIKNKLFYFGSYEGDFLRQSNSGILSIPAPTQLSGNESASGTPIYDPSTGTGRTPFPGNIIPAAEINPIIAKVVALIPPTNLPGCLNNLYENEPSSYNLHKIDTKFDYTPTNKLRISFRYGDQPYNAYFAPVYGPILGGSHSFTACGACNYQQHGSTLAISSSASYVFSPTFVVDATFGVTQAHQYLLPTESTEKYGLDDLGIPGTNTGNLPWAGGVPKFTMSNYVVMGDSYTALEYKDPIFEYMANATKIKGSHTLRFGFDISRQHENHIETAPTNFTFTGGVTSLNGGPSANQYNQIADFLLGLPQSVTNSLQIQQPLLTLRTWEFGLYARDQWQVNRKLTVNYGVRWEHYPVPTQESKGINFYNPATDIVQECGVGGVSSNCGIKVSNLLFAPSFGLAYRVTESLVIRAGFSLSPVQNNMSSDGLMGYPDEVNVSYSGANSYAAFSNISNGIPAIVPPILTNGATLAPAGTGNLFTDPPNFKRGYAESFNVTIQKEFKGGWTVQSGYVGTHVVHQYTEYNLNYGQLGGGTASEPLYKYGITGSATISDPLGSDVYHSWQTTLAKRFSHGLTTRLAYTYSHDISMNTSILIPQYRNYDRYTSTLDRPSALVWAASYDLPFGKGQQFLQQGVMAQVAGGWKLGGIFTHYSGIPFSITSSATSCNCPGNTQTANQILPGVSVVGSGLGGQPYFKSAGFRPRYHGVVWKCRFRHASRTRQRQSGFEHLPRFPAH
jgi:TonB dependent receptor